MPRHSKDEMKIFRKRKNVIRKLKSSGLTYAAIGEKFGISRQRVHQILAPTEEERKSLIEPKNGVCDRCKMLSVRLDIHHVGYSKSGKLEILCPACHSKADREIGTRPIKKPYNYVSIPKNNTYGYRGVHFHNPTKKWSARIRSNHRRITSKYFNSLYEAALAYDKMSLSIKGQKSILNFPEKAPYKVRNSKV